MAVTAAPYGAFLTELGVAGIDFTTDTINVALLTATYTPDLDNHDVFPDVASAEATGTGYSQGGVALSNVSWAYDATTNRAVLSANPASWASLSVTARYAVIYKTATSSRGARLIGLIDFGTDRSYSAEPLQLTFSSGVVRLNAA